MHVLVTGCCGFIGSHLCERLLSEGHTVVGCDLTSNVWGQDSTIPNPRKRKDSALKKIRGHQMNQNFTFHDIDIADTPAIVRKNSELLDVVCHLGALAGVRPSLTDPARYITVNIQGTVTLMDACKNHDIKLVFASSSSVYGLNTKIPFSEDDPTLKCNSPYACSKRSCETFGACYSRLYNTDITALRFFTVYGPRGRQDMAPFKFLKMISEGTPINVFGDGSTERDYTYIDDIITGVMGAIKKSKTNAFSCYNLGSCTPYKLREFIETCERVTGKKAIINQMELQPGDVPKTYANSQKANSDLGFFVSTPLEQGLRETFRWMNEELQ